MLIFPCAAGAFRYLLSDTVRAASRHVRVYAFTAALTGRSKFVGDASLAACHKCIDAVCGLGILLILSSEKPTATCRWHDQRQWIASWRAKVECFHACRVFGNICGLEQDAVQKRRESDIRLLQKCEVPVLRLWLLSSFCLLQVRFRPLGTFVFAG